ncbi:hypothetical protein TELCIR_09819 [Teladorsagia circumcincta]|uniref:Uncharacterized protein n=1 Tax=Teladorsagia circumcincta TaxID=45464 RepID=A0A2G9UDU2_TELCI|nr:hypothetical protein TELCIR_09819 [Teladorsagia circumcincta]
METPLGWEEVVESSDDAFYTLCALDDNTVVAAMSTHPVNMFSKYGEDMVVMDKSGRFMCFSVKGEYKGLLAEIDAYLANGFCIKDNAALIAFSGVVLDQDNRTICDDWLEWINLDGSSWRKQREQQKEAAKS